MPELWLLLSPIVPWLGTDLLEVPNILCIWVRDWDFQWLQSTWEYNICLAPSGKFLQGPFMCCTTADAGTAVTVSPAKQSSCYLSICLVPLSAAPTCVVMESSVSRSVQVSWVLLVGGVDVGTDFCPVSKMHQSAFGFISIRVAPFLCSSLAEGLACPSLPISRFSRYCSRLLFFIPGWDYPLLVSMFPKSCSCSVAEVKQTWQLWGLWLVKHFYSKASSTDAAASFVLELCYFCNECP